MSKNLEPIAIIGIGCRFPQANTPEAFWRLLSTGVNAITEVPLERWNIESFYDPDPQAPNKMNTRWGGFLNQVDLFDPQFFGIAPREAVSIDPKQRLLLEVTWEALEDAGQIPENLAGTQTGVFIGISSYDYYELLMNNRSNNNIDAYAATGNNNCIAAHRISYVFDFNGPSIAVDTACSSSLVAVHLACQSLWNGESSIAVAGGVHVMLSPWVTVSFTKGGFMAPDGLCKAFDAEANGYVRGEGAGVVILKPLSQAVADNDPIYAVIRGSAINQDGRSNGLTAPNPRAQEAVLRSAYKRAGVSPGQVQYIEAHGTGTKLGDLMEMKALGKVLSLNRLPENYCAVGSVKTNIGHLEAAAGIAGLIKVAISLKYKQIPPSLHFHQPNPYIPFDKLLLRVQQKLEPWPNTNNLALAGISSFGFGGTNVHMVLEEVSEVRECQKNAIYPSKHILTLSAKSEIALQAMALSYKEFLTLHPDVAIGDVCFTANTKRSHFDYRLAVVTKSTIELRDQLAAFADGEEIGLSLNHTRTRKSPKIAFLFTGQGSQYIGMAKQLYFEAPIFRKTLDYCNHILLSYLEKPLLEILYSEDVHSNDLTNNLESKLNQTAYTQPALFAIEYALVQLWKSWGVEPSIVMGHSLGEYVAACVAGVFSLEDGLKLVAERGRLMQSLPQEGEMVAVNADVTKVSTIVQSYTSLVSIAAINGAHVVISGQREIVKKITTALEAEGIKTKQLQVSHAFHSPLMAPMLPAFEEVAASITYSSPQLNLVSNVTGQIIGDEIATKEYWCRHVLQPVKFAASIETLAQSGYEIFLEIGCQPILSNMGRRCLPKKVGVWLPSFRQGKDDWEQILHSLSELYVRGAKINWSAFEQEYTKFIHLPNYPFQRQRYWLQTSDDQHQEMSFITQDSTEQLINLITSSNNISDSEAKLLPKLIKLLVQHQQATSPSIKDWCDKDWFYEIQWRLKPRQHFDLANILSSNENWLIFADFNGVGKALAELLQAHGQNCFLVYSGNDYKLLESQAWIINPANKNDFENLFQDIYNNVTSLRGVIHLWSLTHQELEQAQVFGCASLLHLVQTVAKQNQAIMPKIWVVTQGTQAVEFEQSNNHNSNYDSYKQIMQSPLWGLGKVIALEHPEIWGGLLDLAFEIDEDIVKMLLSEILNSEGEDHLAFRSRQRYVARLVRKGLFKAKKVETKDFLSNDATYLITGGYGALGLKVAEWMLNQGAKYLVLLGRHGVSEKAKEITTKMEETGAKIVIIQADVSSQDDMKRVLDDISAAMPILRGIVHAAGVLDDGILLQQNWERFSKVMAPKVQGAWNLHILTQNLTLDFFVCFSSATSLLGSPGQGNYAAANAFLDALAHYRQKQGLSGLSINWGQWAHQGMVANLDSRHQKRQKVLGFIPIEPEQGLQLLGLIKQTIPQIGVLPIDWSVFKENTTSQKIRLLTELLSDVDAQEKTITQKYSFLQQLKAAQDNSKKDLLITHIQKKVTKLLHLQYPQLPDPEEGLFAMGMDSLMLVELKNSLDVDLATTLPTTLVFECSTIQDLADYLLHKVLQNDSQLFEPESVPVPLINELSLNTVDDALLTERLEKLERLLKSE